MFKVYVKVDNVYFASRWFNDRHGKLKEGKLAISSAKLLARTYQDTKTIVRDAELLGISLDVIEIEKAA